MRHASSEILISDPNTHPAEVGGVLVELRSASRMRIVAETLDEAQPSDEISTRLPHDEYPTSPCAQLLKHRRLSHWGFWSRAMAEFPF
jgi:hypothetical protein